MSMSSDKLQVVRELHAPARKHFSRRRVIIKGYDDLWQADIVDMRAYAKQNSGFQYILTVIDTFSKYAWAEPLKTKQGSEVMKKFSDIIIKSERKPSNLQTDDGKEFYNKDFQKLVQKHDINHYSTYSVMKASIVERWNRTLKNNMWKLFTLNGSYKWIKILPKLVNDYNKSRHSTIKMKPSDVSRDNEQKFLNSVYNRIKIAVPGKYNVGDFIRVSKYKNLFAKGYTPNWTTEIFKVKTVKHTNPVTYLIQDLQGKDIYGGFYELELQKVKYPDVYLVEKVVRSKGNKLYVKWLGLSDAHNSWISKKDVIV